jgi:signal transduction histidine kinase
MDGQTAGGTSQPVRTLARTERGPVGRAARAVSRAIAALLSGAGTGALAGAAAWAALFTLAFVPLTFGLPFLVIMVWLVRPLARLERRRVQWVTGRTVAEAYRPLRGSPVARLRTLFADLATWRDLAWLIVHFLVGFWVAAMCLLFTAAGAFGIALPIVRALTPHHVIFAYGIQVTDMARAFAVVPIALIVMAAAGWACGRVAAWSARLSGVLLAPSERARMRAQMEHLAATRAETVDARAAELRRIERDLHDGAQARLVSLAMSLGMAEEEIRRNPDAAAALVAEARVTAGTALAELRDLVRGIHPPVLTERGLGGAVEALALACAVPVDVDVRLDHRLAAPLESALYFVIAEALANIAHHSAASSAFVRLWRRDDRLCLLIHDDGQGGADPTRGSGLRGIQRRLAAFDGQLTLTSPPGGPTELFVELPCPP